MLRSNPLPLILAFILLALTPQLSYQSLAARYEIKDLETNDYRFISDAKKWTYTTLNPSVTDSYTFCSQRYILGGPGKLANNAVNGAFYEKTFTDLPVPHVGVYFTAHLWFMKGWAATDTLAIEFDGVPYNQFTNNLLRIESNTVNQCGGTWMADVGLIRVYGSFAHIAPTLKVKLTAKISRDSYQVTFGLRNLTLNFATTIPTTLPPASFCMLWSSFTLPSSSTLYVRYALAAATSDDTTWKCFCSEGMYRNTGGTCSVCHMSCAACFGNTAKHCYRCQEGFAFNGESCLSCGESCTTCLGTTGGLLDTQNVCRECVNMTLEYTRPTPMGHQYLLKLEPYTCNMDSAAVFKYLNGDPELDEIFPPSTFSVNRIFRNTYIVDIIFEKSLVYNTDLNITMQYLNTTITVPRKFVPSPTLQNMDDVFLALKILLAVIIVLSIFGTYALDSTASLWSFVSLMQFIANLRYLNIEFPKLIEKCFAIGDAANWSLLPNVLGLIAIPGVTEEDIDDMEASLPAGVYVHEYHMSMLLYTAGAIILATFIILLITLIVILAGSGPREETSVFMKSLRAIFRWNFVLRFYLITGIPLALWLSLQLRFFAFENGYQSACCALALIFCGYFVFMLVTVINILKNQDSTGKSRFRRLYGTLTGGITIEKSSGRHYHLLIFLRGVLSSLLIGFVDTIPFLQISLLIYCNVGITYYLFQQAVFSDTKLQTINKVKEILILLAEVFILCINVQVASISYYEVMEWLILSMLVPVMLLELFYLVGQQLIGAGIIFASAKKFCQLTQICMKRVRTPLPRLDGRRGRNPADPNDETDIN